LLTQTFNPKAHHLTGFQIYRRFLPQPENRTDPFAGNHRFFRDLRAGFSGVIGVIQADTDKLSHLANTGAETRFTADQRQTLRIELTQFIQRFRL
jgi:hypothetical protein